MENNKERIEEIILWPMPGGKYKKARILSDRKGIYEIEIDDPEIGIVNLNSVSFIKLLRFLSGKEFAGTTEKLILK